MGKMIEKELGVGHVYKKAFTTNYHEKTTIHALKLQLAHYLKKNV